MLSGFYLFWGEVIVPEDMPPRGLGARYIAQDVW